MNPHYHVAALDGVFVAAEDPAEPARFVPAVAVDDEHIADVLQAFVTKLKRLLVKAGRLDEAGQLTERVQVEEHAALDALGVAAVTGALPAGPEHRAGRDLRAVCVRELGALCVEQHSFSLHAKTVVDGDDESARESLLKYMLRPPLAARRIRQLPNGLVRIQLKRPFADGTFAIDLDPVSLLVRLASSVPPPRLHTLRYAGVFASRSRWRSRVLRVPKHPPAPGKPASHRSRYIPWIALRSRTFREDVEVCPRPGCGGRMKLLALVQDRDSIRRFLTYLGEPTDPPVLAPARGPPWWKSTVQKVARRHAALTSTSNFKPPRRTRSWSASFTRRASE